MIAGTAKNLAEKKKLGKTRASVYCPAKVAVKLLRVVMDTLREISDVRLRDQGIKWPQANTAQQGKPARVAW